ncbi:MAG: hypothetical protein QNJ47_17880 [Nostocaceae cyanobacterium]|nr:hypothetical protein [Nostocaceae cyanobacterium]
MSIKFTKGLYTLAAIVTFILFLPGISLALPAPLNTTSTSIIAQFPTDSAINLTPRVRQQLQGVRQRRNRDIQAVLDPSEIAELRRYIRSGDNLHQAIEKLTLQPDRREMIQAIVKISDLKMKAILSQYTSH